MLNRLFRAIDEHLRRSQNIVEFCGDADCLFRVRFCRAERAFPLERGAIPEGAEMLELHYWNEHLPRPPEGGPDLMWAAKGRRMLMASLAKLADWIENTPEARGVEGVFAITTFLSPGEAQTGERLMARLGFRYEPFTSGAFRDFWENVYVWFLNRTFGEGRVRRRSVWGLRRVLVWMPRENLLARFGTGAEQRSRAKAAASERGNRIGERKDRVAGLGD